MTATAFAPDLARYRAEFPVFRHTTYLNSCSLGALSARSRARVNGYLDLWERRGAAAWYDTWLPAVESLRAGYGRMVGAEPSSISIQSCISAALGVVASALDYRARPRVVTTSLDFPTVVYQWQARVSGGIELVVLESPDGLGVPLELFEEAVDDRTALVATSHVFFTSGQVQDVAALARLTHARGARLLIDGYQATGQVPVHAGELGVDFYCSGGLKWLLGGSGIAFLYVDPALAGTLRPEATGWFAHAEPFRFDARQFEPAADARRFDLGTPAVAAVYAQLGGLEVIEEIGVPAIRAATSALTEDLIADAAERGLRPRVARRVEERSGIVMLPRRDPAADVRQLAEAGFTIDARPGHLRVSPYFYNLPEDHRALLEHLPREA
jgi:selenocysteine lyase/cysteine desulfurase